MKLFTVFAGVVAVTSPLVSASPVIKYFAKRATVSVEEVASTGYATQNGGTTGGKGGSVVTVSTLAEFQSAVSGSDSKIIIVSGTITGKANVKIGSNKSIIGQRGAKFSGIGLYVKDVKNVIIRNIISEKVLAANGDAIGIQNSKNVWVDHVELYSDKTHGKDYYDGLLDVTHASEWVTLSNIYLHDHYKASLIGHSNSNAAEDTGHLHVTQHNNYWKDLSTRMPSFRFGTGHIYNSYFENCDNGLETRKGAEILVQSNVYSGVKKPIFSDGTGKATAIDNDFGTGKNTAPAGSINATSVPYKYELLGSANVRDAIVGVAGATLDF